MKIKRDQVDTWGKMGAFLFQFRYTVIAILCMLAIILGIFAPKLPEVLGGDGFQTKGDYQKTKAILDKDFKQSQDTLSLVFQKNKGISNDAFQKEIAEIVAKIQTKETYESFHHPLENKSMLQNDLAYATILFSGKTSKERNEKNITVCRKNKKRKQSYLESNSNRFSEN